MYIKLCPACSKSINYTSDVCPLCGHTGNKSKEEWSFYIRWQALLGPLLAILLITSVAWVARTAHANRAEQRQKMREQDYKCHWRQHQIGDAAHGPQVIRAAVGPGLPGQKGCQP
jgi:hypothetical protein